MRIQVCSSYYVYARAFQVSMAQTRCYCAQNQIAMFFVAVQQLSTEAVLMRLPSC